MRRRQVERVVAGLERVIDAKIVASKAGNQAAAMLVEEALSDLVESFTTQGDDEAARECARHVEWLSKLSRRGGITREEADRFCDGFASALLRVAP